MSRLTAKFAAAIAALTLGACATPPAPSPTASAASPPLTVLISIDAFRAEYLKHGVTPTLSALAAGGAQATMRPSFPSKTFPNHYALVTGLRPDRNGIVDNNMIDPTVSDATFRMADVKVTSDARWWEEATPIWVTAERAGIRTALMFWPGADDAIHGVRPSQWKAFDMTVPPLARTDQLLQWLDAPAATRARFATLYFDDVDTAGHDFGPNSPQLNEAAAKVDAAIARLLQGLKDRGLAANVIVVADHGMAATPKDEQIYFDDLFPPADVRVMAAGAFLSLYPKPGHEAQVDKALIAPHAHMQCWRKAEIPARFHYGKNPRVPPYFCLAETGWSITTHDFKSTHDKGNHGYDPYAWQMAAVFIANGPAFRHGVVLPGFDNVDVYPLLAKLLGVKPEPNDGRLADLAGALK